MEPFPRQSFYADIMIIGAGVAGLTLAEHLAQSGKKILLLGRHYDSQITKAGIIENSTHVSPEEKGLWWIEKKHKMVQGSGILLRSSNVLSLVFENGQYIAQTKFADGYAPIVVIATGSHQQKFGFKGEEEFFHKGLSDCAVCDANLYREKDVAILGNHQYTLKSAVFISSIVKSICVLWVGNEDMTTLPYYEKLKQLDNVTFYNNPTDIEIGGKEYVEFAKFNLDGEEHVIAIEGIFVEGHPQPNTEIFRGVLDMDEAGHLIVDNYLTSKPNVYAIGDVIGDPKSIDKAIRDAEALSEILLSKVS